MKELINKHEEVRNLISDAIHETAKMFRRPTDGGKGELMMADREKYIEVLSKAVKTIKESNENAPIKISLGCIEDILELLKEQPEIIRCKDCKHLDPEDHHCDSGHDIVWQLSRRDDWFCADGERRTDT